MTRPNHGLASFFLFLAISGWLCAQEPLKPLRTDTPPVIDGNLEEALWREAPFVTGYKTFIPDFGLEMVEKTFAYMAYDSENLYFAFRCLDSQPEKIKASIANRDTIRPDDWICINLDSFNDHQALYALYVNPLGIQADSIFAGGVEDHSADLVWYSAGRLNDQGYTVEVRIPFKSIRFAGKERVEMAVIFERRISRRSEQGTYPALSADQGYFFLTQMKPMIFHDIKNYTLLELLPAFTWSQKHSHQEGALTREKDQRDLSLTAKYGISPRLILDATYNPDFSQVESDAGQVDVNLRYDLFFLEKRPFFLEGHENFNIAGSNEFLNHIVHTRTIVDPRAGVKLTGKLGRKDTIASIFALDESPRFEDESDLTGNYAKFSILRYKRSLKDDSYLGAVYTGRDLNDRFNRVLGSDGQIRINPSSVMQYHGFFSTTKVAGDAAAVDGNALHLGYQYDTRKLGLRAGVDNISQDFQTLTGYLTRGGITQVGGAVTPHFYPHGKLIRKVTAILSSYQLRDHYDNLNESHNGLSFSLVMWRNTRLSLTYLLANEVYRAQRFDTNALMFQGSSQITKQFYIKLTYRGGRSIYYSEDPYQGRGNRGTATFIFQPSENFNETFSLVYSDFHRSADSAKIYDYTILRNKFTYQMNKYLFFRAIIEYNTYYKRLLTDLLASFTYIPGTVVQLGYGNLFEKLEWVEGEYRPSTHFLEIKRGLFFKVSYLWRF